MKKTPKEGRKRAAGRQAQKKKSRDINQRPGNTEQRPRTPTTERQQGRRQKRRNVHRREQGRQKWKIPEGSGKQNERERTTESQRQQTKEIEERKTETQPHRETTTEGEPRV